MSPRERSFHDELRRQPQYHLCAASREIQSDKLVRTFVFGLPSSDAWRLMHDLRFLRDKTDRGISISGHLLLRLLEGRIRGEAVLARQSGNGKG